MKYTEVKISPNSGGLDGIEVFLDQIDVTSYMMEDPSVVAEILDKKFDYAWDYVSDQFLEAKKQRPSITVYLDQESLEDQDKLVRIKEMAKISDWDIEITIADEEDWNTKYKEHFKTIDLTDEIRVVPSWEHAEGRPGVDFLSLDPGMAFGTGTHETTSLCAVLMAQKGCEDRVVLDIGTGSGILAIAAAMLGSNQVYGVDIDPLAVEIASQNVELNNCKDKVTIEYGDLTKGLKVKGDMVVANLMAELVVVLTGHIKEHLNPGGVYICSGILVEKEEMVLEALKKHGFTDSEVLRKGEWCAIAAKYE